MRHASILIRMRFSRRSERSAGWSAHSPMLSAAVLALVASTGGTASLAAHGADGPQAIPDRTSVAGISPGPWTREAELHVGPRATGNTRFGGSVALSGNGRVALVSGQIPTANKTDGRQVAEVYRLMGNKRWTGPTRLHLGVPHAYGNRYDLSVALSADGDTALVGTPGITVDGNPQAVVAEAFRFDGRRWSQRALLGLGQAAPADDFMDDPVALSRDGDTAIVGAPNRRVGGEADAGAAEVFRLRNKKWGRPAQLDLGVSAVNQDCFGCSVALNGTGTMAVVGAPDKTVEGIWGQGTAAVFRFADGRWGAPVRLNPGDSRILEHFGSSVGINGQGTAVIVAAWDHTVHGNQGAGMVQVFRETAQGWDETAQLDLGSRSGWFDYLGGSAAISANGDTVLAGAEYRSIRGEAPNAGAAEAFRGTGSRWSGPDQLTLGTQAGTQDYFGASVALSGSGMAALVGAPGHTVSGRQMAGTAVVFSR